MGLVFRLPTQFVKARLAAALALAQQSLALDKANLALLNAAMAAHPDKDSPARKGWRVLRFPGGHSNGLDGFLDAEKKNVQDQEECVATAAALVEALTDEKHVNLTPDDLVFLRNHFIDAEKALDGSEQNAAHIALFLADLQSKPWEERPKDDEPDDARTATESSGGERAGRVPIGRRGVRGPKAPTLTPVGATSDNPNPTDAPPVGVRDGGTEAPPAGTAPSSGAKSE